MNYEQKYKEALKRARQLCAYPTSKPFISDLQDLFPELKELDDKRIREEIEQFLKLHDCWNKEWYDWLEKQGGQKLYVNDNAKEMFIKALERVEEQNSKGYKLTDCDKNSWWEDFKTYTFEQNLANSAKTCKAESIFEVGKWIVANESKYTFLVKKGAPRFQAEGTNGDIYSFYLLPNGEEEYHLWSIEDAKDGDVLVNGSNIFIFHFINDTRLMGYCHVNTDDGRFYDDLGKNECFCLIDAVVTPATKEQQDLLFSKMKEAGYEWDANTKELIKL